MVAPPPSVVTSLIVTLLWVWSLAAAIHCRDCRTVNNITFATVTADGPKLEDPVKLQTEWSFEAFVAPKAGADTGGSW